MKNYLSKNEQFFCLSLTAILNQIELKLNNNWYELPEERKFLKYCKTYSGKYLRTIFKRIGSEEYKRLEKFNNQYDLKVFPKGGAELERVNLDKDSMLDLIEYAIDGKCDNCIVKDPSTCRLRSAMINAFVPQLNFDGGCEYYVGG